MHGIGADMEQLPQLFGCCLGSTRYQHSVASNHSLCVSLGTPVYVVCTVQLCTCVHVSGHSVAMQQARPTMFVYLNLYCISYSTPVEWLSNGWSIDFWALHVLNYTGHFNYCQCLVVAIPSWCSLAHCTVQVHLNWDSVSMSGISCPLRHHTPQHTFHPQLCHLSIWCPQTLINPLFMSFHVCTRITICMSSM